MTEEGSFERRIVTVLFADLVGFTPLSERLDAEDVAAIQDAYFAAVRETVGRYAGRLEKFIGDAAVAAFGVPRGRDDDPERAARAGAAIVHAVEDLAARLGLEPGELQVRVGIQTGEVVHAVTGPDAGRVTGDTVNTAARLQAAAPPGRVLLGEATSLAVADIVELEAVEPIALKGKAEPVRACLLTAFRAERSRDAAMGRLRAPTVGRDTERAALRAALARLATRAGGTERWLVIGPPGVGKSRLLAELLADARTAGVPCHRVRVVLEPEAPFAAVAELVRAALAGGTTANAATAATDPATLAAALAAGGLEEPRRSIVADELTRLLDPVARPGETADTGHASRDARFGAWLDGLDALAPGPHLWAVEDLHWAAADLIAFIHAAEQHPGAPRLLVIASRPSLLERAPAMAADPETADAGPAPASAAPAAPAVRHTLDLHPLPSADAATLVRQLVGDSLPPDLIARVAQRADGNPLFIEELLRGWVSTGTLELVEGAWRLATPPEEISLPATVQAIYAAQLDDLPAMPRLAARRASVSGRRVPLDALRVLDIADRDEAIDVLVRRDILATAEPDPVGGEAVAFRHALLRDVGYASLARAERALLHLRLGRWLEATAGPYAEAIAAAIAAHWELAVATAPALAAEVGDGVSRAEARRTAASWLERGAAVALRIAAYEGAADLLRRALALTDDDQPIERGRRLTALADAEGIDSLEQARDGYAAAVDLLTPFVPADGADHPARTIYAEAAAKLTQTHIERLEFDAADFACAVALATLGPREDAARIRLEIHRNRSTAALDNDYAAALARAKLLLEAAERIGDPALIRAANEERVGSLHEADQADPADWEAVAAAAHAAGDIGAAISAATNGALLRVDVDPRGVGRAIDAIEPLVEAHRRIEDGCWLDYVRAEADLLLGAWDAVLAGGTRVLDVGEAHGFDRVVVRTLHCLVPVADRRGERVVLERCADWFERRRWAFPRSPFGTLHQAAVDARFRRAGILQGGPPDLEALRPGLSLGEGGPSWMTSLETVVERWLELGEIGVAREALRLMRAAGTGGNRLGAVCLALLEARLAEAEGRADADGAARRAIELADVIPTPWWSLQAWRVLVRIDDAPPDAPATIARLEARLGLAAKESL